MSTPENLVATSITLTHAPDTKRIGAFVLWLMLNAAERFTLKRVKERKNIGNVNILTDFDTGKYTPIQTLMGLGLVEKLPEPVVSNHQFQITLLGEAVLQKAQIDVRAHINWYIEQQEERHDDPT